LKHLAVVGFCFSLVCTISPSLAKTTPQWLVLQPGLKLFTGTDGGVATTVTVCNTLGQYQRFITQGEDVNCRHYKPGIKVHIISLAAGDQTVNPFLDIAADDGSWSGWTGTLISVEARIPVGTVVKVKPNSNGSAQLFATQTDQSGVVLRDGTVMKILRQDAVEADNSALYVRVMSGQHSGRTGWISDLSLSLDDGSDLILHR